MSVTRRRLLRSSSGMAGLAGLAALAAAAGCAPPEPPAAGGAPTLRLPKDVSGADKRVRWANWTAYLDYDEKAKTYPTLQAFTKATGIKASYSESIDDNDTYVSKVTPKLRAGQDIGPTSSSSPTGCPTGSSAISSSSRWNSSRCRTPRICSRR